MNKTCTKCNMDSDYWSPIKNAQHCLYCHAFISDEKSTEKVKQGYYEEDGSFNADWAWNSEPSPKYLGVQ